MTEWEIHGMEFGNCNCSYGCPCQFNALPTYGNCQAVGFIGIDKGRFGPTRLDGLKMAFAIAWPGAVHQGLAALVDPLPMVDLPDIIEDDWIESVEKLEKMMDEYIHLRQEVRDVFEIRYQETIDPDKDRWELCSRVLARRDVVDRLSAPW